MLRVKKIEIIDIWISHSGPEEKPGYPNGVITVKISMSGGGSKVVEVGWSYDSPDRAVKEKLVVNPFRHQLNDFLREFWGPASLRAYEEIGAALIFACRNALTGNEVYKAAIVSYEERKQKETKGCI